MTAIPIHPNRKDRQQAETLSGFGASEQFIADHLNLSLEDLRTYYPKQLAHGQEEANLRVAQTFFDMATSGEHPAATIAWLKMRGGWSEKVAETIEEDSSSLEVAKDKLLTLLNRAH